MPSTCTSSVARLIFFSTFLVVVSQAAFDTYLPALPTITDQFHAPNYLGQLSVSSFYLGLAIFQLLGGIASDSFGRKPVILPCILFFIAGSLLCSFSSNIYMFIFARFLQGVGIGPAGPVARALLRDKISGKELAKAFSICGIFWGVTPLAAPILGNAIFITLSWEAIFYGFALLGLILCTSIYLGLPETRDSEHMTPFKIPQILTNIKSILNSKKFLYFTLVTALTYGIFTTFATASPFILQEYFHYTSTEFSFAIAAMSLGFVIGTTLSNKLLNAFTSLEIIHRSLQIMLLAYLPMLLLSYLYPNTSLAFITPFFVISTAIGLILPNSSSSAIQEFPTLAGTASALYGFTVFITCMTIAAITSALPESSTLPTIYLLIALALLAIFFSSQLRAIFADTQ